jgi:GT2 family glycosyltransferase
MYSDDVDLEIVVVDNASSDGSPAYLSSWAASRPNVRLVLNSDNRGFAAGNNQGLAAASGGRIQPVDATQ